MYTFVPSGISEKDALEKTTHLAISAHQDDIEFMAYHGVLECFGSKYNHFTAAIVTDGAGSPRSGIYADYTGEEMQNVRREEQKKAAIVGEYAAQIFLDFPSSAVKEKTNDAVVDELVKVIEATKPTYIYTHNLADKHDTHVGVVVKVIKALRKCGHMPKAIYGCEVWRDLDWLNQKDKVQFDVSGRPNLENALLGVFDSQISGGKRYDLAVVGRRLSNATFAESHGVDETNSVIYGMDLTPLIADKTADIAEFVVQHINNFSNDVRNKIQSVD